jgi:uncharacterized protein YbbC (DUF1343 family)
MSSGFVITHNGSVSTQCDIVVFDRDSTPTIESAERQRFFPVETVCAIGEVKSRLSKSDLSEALNKLARVKQKRLELAAPAFIKKDPRWPYDAKKIPYDNITTFLICQKLTFNVEDIASELSNMYEPDIAQYDKHNMILSIEDGIALYIDDAEMYWMAPVSPGGVVRDALHPIRPGPNSHFHVFASYFSMLMAGATVMYPDFTNYVVR